MTTPNRFARNGSFLVASLYNPDTDIDSRIGSLPNGQWFISEVDRFINSDEYEDATITISNGNISKFTFKALSIAIKVDGSFVTTTNLDEILDFFTLP